MKKFFVYILCMIFLFFLIPVLFTHKYKTKKEYKKLEEKKEEYNYKDLNKVKVLHIKTGEVEEMELDSYIIGVVSAEMPANFEIEALKAQAVVARAYTIYKITKGTKHENADICDDPSCCQAWINKEERLNRWNEEERNLNWSKIEEAVESTKGKVITYEGKPINAFFHSNSGGFTESAFNVWGGENYPYLNVVATSGEDSYKQYNSEVQVTKNEFIEKIKKYHQDFEIDFKKENEIQVLEYTDGKRIKTIKIGNLNLSGVEIRTIFNLKSARFEIIVDGENIKFNVIRLWPWSWNESNRSR